MINVTNHNNKKYVYKYSKNENKHNKQAVVKRKGLYNFEYKWYNMKKSIV